MNRATNATFEPTAAGGGVSHSTDVMSTYHSGALLGSPAYPATVARGRAITISVWTSTPATRVTLAPNLRQYGGCVPRHADASSIGSGDHDGGAKNPSARPTGSRKLKSEP